MSYGFSMLFKQLKENESPLKFIESVKNDVANRSVDILKRSLVPYLPSLDRRFGKEYKIDDNWHIRASGLDEEWLQHVYDMDFVYWEDEYLVGMCCGSWYDNPCMFDTEFYFQNSTDQDYEFDCWSDDIDAFYKAKLEVVDLAAKDIHSKYLSYCDLEDVQEYPEYYRKVALYENVFNRLHLEDWLTGNNKDNPSFTSIRVNPISQHNLMELAITLDGWKMDKSDGLRYMYMQHNGMINSNKDVEQEDNREI